VNKANIPVRVFHEYLLAISSMIILIAGFILPLSLSNQLKSGDVGLIFLSVFMSSILTALGFWWERLSKSTNQKWDGFNYYYLLSLFFFGAAFNNIVYLVYAVFYFPDLVNKDVFDKISIWVALGALVITVVTAYYLVTIQGTLTQARDLMNKLEGWNQQRHEENELWKQKVASLDDVINKDHDTIIALTKQILNLSLTTHYSFGELYGDSVSNKLDYHEEVIQSVHYFHAAVKLFKDVSSIQNVKNRKYQHSIEELLTTIRSINYMETSGYQNDPLMNNYQRKDTLLPSFYYDSLYANMLEIKYNKGILLDDSISQSMDELISYLRLNCISSN
jgi:oligoribonuclease (3'-5' exoribonuclease)